MTDNKRTFLVLGGGFIGLSLARHLAKKGDKVRVFDRLKMNEHSDFETVSGDFTNIQDINHALNGITTVIHCLSTTVPKTSNDNIAFDIDTNLKGTVQLLNAMTCSNIKEIIFCSSGGTVYGLSQSADEQQATDPICSYGITKLAIEKHIKMNHHLSALRYQILRISNPYGPGQHLKTGQGAITAFLDNLFKKNPLTVFGDGAIARDYIYIDDLCTIIVNLVNQNIWNETINIGSGTPTTLAQIITQLKTIHDGSFEVNHLPPRKFDLPFAVLNIEKLKGLLGEQLHIRSLAEGLQQSYNAFRKKNDRN